MKHQESLEQQNLFQWAAVMAGQHPELALMFHIPNGGYRNAREAARLKSESVKAGVSDVLLPVARGGYHGLWVEMKAAGGKLSKPQADWLVAMQKQGYYAQECYGWEHARQLIEWYLRLPAGGD